jgi:hypothetical protein
MKHGHIIARVVFFPSVLVSAFVGMLVYAVVSGFEIGYKHFK